MPRKYLVISAVLILAAGGFFFFFLKTEKKPDRPPEMPAAESTRQEAVPKASVNLYFADKESLFLMAEPQTLSRLLDPVAFGRVVLTALVRGPRGGSLMRTFPEGTALRAFYVAEDGTAYVDLSETAFEMHPGGVRTELLSIYSVVNSLVLNMDEIKSVKILIGGREVMTLAGHIDVRFPLKANMLLIR